ncbi:MAG: ABC transporter permease [Tannerella sp.]|jgi:cell division protein FtsX|nr:ABC transporter permease [Tannerella sp.]
MIKSIFKQIRNQKRSNVWISIELLLVFIIVWFLADASFLLVYNSCLTDTRNIDNAWQVNIAEYPDSYARYSADESTEEARAANFERVLQTLRSYPGVEAVAIVSADAEPESGSFSGIGMTSIDDTTRMIAGQRISTDPRGDYFRAFGYVDRNGKPVSVQDFDVTVPKGVIIGQLEADYFFPDGRAVGRELRGRDKTDLYRVIGVVGSIKNAFMGSLGRYQSTFYMFPARSSNRFTVRMNKSVLESFKKDMNERLQIGNFYLKNVVPYNRLSELSKDMQGLSSIINIGVSLMIFFLLNILLCVMGTFWYRINTRREEIGLRKALGSSSAGVRNSLILEGLCLLTIAMVPAMLIEYQFVYAGMTMTKIGGGMGPDLMEYLPDRQNLRFLITNGITWAIMAAVIAVAIVIPAQKAASLPPAEALHYE